MLLHLLGPPRLTLGTNNEDAFRNEKAKVLLAYLARARSRSATRQELIGLLWPEVPDDRAAGSLRQAIRAIRAFQRAHGAHFLEADRAVVRLVGDDLAIDVDRIRSALTSGDATDIEAVLRKWRSGVFSGLNVGGEEFDDWIVAEKASLEREFIEAAVRRIQAAVAATHDRNLIASLSRFVVELDPVHELANEELLKLHVRTGDRSKALDQFARYTQAMRRDFGLPPSPAMQTLVGSLSADQATAPAIPLPFGRPGVLIRIVRKQGQTQRALDLAAEELVHRLAPFKHLALLSPPDIATAGKGPDGASEVRRKVRFENNPDTEYQVRLSPSATGRHILIELTDFVSGRVLLHDRLGLADLEGRVDLNALFAPHAARVEKTVLNDVLERDETRGTVVGSWAYAVDLIKDFDPGSIEKACAVLQRTIASAGQRFAPLHAAMASALLTRRLYRPSEDAKTELIEARQRIETALTIDPWDAYSHRIAGWAAFQARDFDRGMEHFDTSLGLNTSDPYAHMSAAEAYAYSGRIDEAGEHADQAFRVLKVVPPYFYSYVATVLFASGDFGVCAEYCDRGPEQSAEVLMLKAAALGKLKKRSQAAETIRLAREASPYTSDRAIGEWLSETNMFHDTRNREDYMSGLESAGLRTIRHSFESRPS
jgi:DNA-binding SARP family transcriptional activator